MLRTRVDYNSELFFPPTLHTFGILIKYVNVIIFIDHRIPYLHKVEFTKVYACSEKELHVGGGILAIVCCLWTLGW